MLHDFLGLSEPQFAALLNAVIYTTCGIFAGVCLWYLWTIRKIQREAWIKTIVVLMAIFFASLALHRLWWNFGIWTDAPGDTYVYGAFFQDHRNWLAIPVVALALSAWGVLWTLANVQSVRCVLCVVVSFGGVMLASCVGAVLLTPAP